MKLLALRKLDPKHPGCYHWLIANGPNMGRWTGLFGVNCLADLVDNKEYVKNIHLMTEGSVIESYCLTKEDGTDIVGHIHQNKGLIT